MTGREGNGYGITCTVYGKEAAFYAAKKKKKGWYWNEKKNDKNCFTLTQPGDDGNDAANAVRICRKRRCGGENANGCVG